MSDPAAHATYLGRKYLPELDGLRALSAVMVVAVHMHAFQESFWGWFAGGRGVTVFFVLSGYLITTLGLREEGQRGAVCLPAFYARRCCRLFPLYYLVLGVYYALVFTADSHAALRPALRAALPYFLLYQQEVLLCSRQAAGDFTLPFFQSWSLGVEEKFYLLWPLLAFALWRAAPARRLRGTLALIAALAPTAGLLALPDVTCRAVGKCLFPHYHILVGCLLGQLLHDRRWFERLRFLGRASWAALTAVLFLAAHLLTPWVAHAEWLARPLDLVYSPAVALLLTSVLLGGGALTRLLRWAPLVFVGRLSYGFYLVHMLALVAVQRALPAAEHRLDVNVLAFALACGLSVGAAWALAVAVERPGIELGRRLSRRLSEPRTQRGGVSDPWGAAVNLVRAFKGS